MSKTPPKLLVRGCGTLIICREKVVEKRYFSAFAALFLISLLPRAARPGEWTYEAIGIKDRRTWSDRQGKRSRRLP